MSPQADEKSGQAHGWSTLASGRRWCSVHRIGRDGELFPRLVNGLPPRPRVSNPRASVLETYSRTENSRKETDGPGCPALRLSALPAATATQHHEQAREGARPACVEHPAAHRTSQPLGANSGRETSRPCPSGVSPRANRLPQTPTQASRLDPPPPPHPPHPRRVPHLPLRREVQAVGVHREPEGVRHPHALDARGGSRGELSLTNLHAAATKGEEADRSLARQPQGSVLRGVPPPLL